MPIDINGQQIWIFLLSAMGFKGHQLIVKFSFFVTVEDNVTEEQQSHRQSAILNGNVLFCSFSIEKSVYL